MVNDDTINNNQQANSTENIANTDGPKVIHKLPRIVRLGLDHVIKVKCVSLGIMKTVAPGGQELDGLWDEANKIIYVDKALSLEDQWETLRHELLHAIIDIDHEVRISPSTSSSDAAAA